jgi:hypothetical protein
MSFFKSKHINQKFNERIETILDAISDSAEQDDTEISSEENLLHLNSETVTIISDIGDDGEEVKKKTVEENHESGTSAQLEDLKTMVATKNEFNSHRKELIDTSIKAGLSVVGILLMLGFEVNHAITSKSLSFMPKPKI